jgi:hypothetical protein
MARRRRQCSDVDTVVLVLSSVPSRLNQSGRAGRCFVHVRWVAVSSNRHLTTILGVREHLYATATAVTFLIVAFYVPLLWMWRGSFALGARSR